MEKLCSAVVFLIMLAYFVASYPLRPSYISQYIRSQNYVIANRCSRVFVNNRPKGFGLPKETPLMPSIDDLAKQQQFRTLLQQYRENTTRKVFDDALQFPTEFTLKVIGTNDKRFVEDMLSVVSNCIEQPAASINHSIKETAAGNYLSLTITPMFMSATQLYATYDALGKDARVKFVL